MTTAPNEHNFQNTPRTRNRLLDNTRLVPSSEGYLKGGWTFRKQIEADFRALGFRSHKFSHKKEPETRLADSLWLSWNMHSKKQDFHTSVADIEARVTFALHTMPYWNEYETIITITHEGWSGGCLPRRMGKAIFIINNDDSRDALAHVQHLLSKPSIR